MYLETDSAFYYKANYMTADVVDSEKVWMLIFKLSYLFKDQSLHHIHQSHSLPSLNPQDYS